MNKLFAKLFQASMVLVLVLAYSSFSPKLSAQKLLKATSKSLASVPNHGFAFMERSLEKESSEIDPLIKSSISVLTKFSNVITTINNSYTYFISKPLQQFLFDIPPPAL